MDNSRMTFVVTGMATATEKMVVAAVVEKNDITVAAKTAVEVEVKVAVAVEVKVAVSAVAAKTGYLLQQRQL
jgi:hypothetical protein